MRQVTNRFADQPDAIAAIGAVVRAILWACQVLKRVLRVIFFVILAGHGAAGMTPAPSRFISRQIDCNGKQPCGKGMARAIPAAALINPDEGFLGQVNGNAPIACIAIQEGNQRLLPTLYEVVERQIIALSQPRHGCLVQGVPVGFFRTGHSSCLS